MNVDDIYVLYVNEYDRYRSDITNGSTSPQASVTLPVVLSYSFVLFGTKDFSFVLFIC